MTSKTYYAYLGVWQKEDDSHKGMAIARDIEAVRKASTSADPITREDTAKADEIEQSDAGLDQTVKRIIDSSYSQSELLFLSSFLVESYPGMAVEREVLAPIEKLNHIVETHDKATVFGLSEIEFNRIVSKLNETRRISGALKALPSALLMSIVATFDTNIADVIRDMLTLKTDIFQTGSKTILISEVLQAESIAAIRLNHPLISPERITR